MNLKDASMSLKACCFCLVAWFLITVITPISFGRP